MQGLAWLLAVLLMALAPGTTWARGGGGCLAEGTLIRTPGGWATIESLQEGDLVWGVSGRKLQLARVEAVTKIEVEAYLEMAVGETMLLITKEHPVMVAQGEFRSAGQLREGDRVITANGDRLREKVVEAVRRYEADRPAYNLMVNPGGTFIPEGVVVHNKGCFLPENLVLRADGSEVPISTIRAGDILLAFTAEGAIVRTQVHHTLRTEVEQYVILRTDRQILRVTADHPFYVGEGTFKTLEALQVGDRVIAWDGKTLAPQKILSMEMISEQTPVYNLQTDSPHTFFVGHLAVHNKGGGGGCFPPGTLIATPQGQVPVESLIPGTLIQAVTADGQQVSATVKALLLARNTLLSVETRHGLLQASPEHPISDPSGNFRPLEKFHRGDRLLRWEGGRLVTDRVRRISRAADETLVYNLQVDEPHTFLASGFVVHNKGGSSSSSSSYHSSSSSSGSSSSEDDTLEIIIGFAVFIVAIILFISFLAFFVGRRGKRGKSENLDFVYSPSTIARKAKRTNKLLHFLSQQDPSVAPEPLRKLAEETFRKLEECWEKRDYGPMETLMMPSLFALHTAQIQGMIRNHEINRIKNLKVEKVDLVNVRYTDKPNQREFTALISASALDYYEHDTTGKFIRGDTSAARFQEFWTFQHLDGKWLLREVEQSGESDYLKDENFVETLTDQNVQGIYAEAAGKEGDAGPWIEKEVETKATRIERMLNFLAQTDKLWDRQQMQERARAIFLRVYLARESRDLAQVPTADLFPEVAENLRDQIRQWQLDDLAAEYRNLCVRKVEIVLVRNYADQAKDEFTVRISAHAQKIVRKGGRTQSEDRYVTPFEDFYTFGRLDNQWKLKEVLPTAAGEKRISEENIDEDSSAGQLQWYYRQTRAN